MNIMTTLIKGTDHNEVVHGVIWTNTDECYAHTDHNEAVNGVVGPNTKWRGTGQDKHVLTLTNTDELSCPH